MSERIHPVILPETVSYYDYEISKYPDRIRVSFADGRTLIKCVPEYGTQIYAFIATAEGRRTVYVAMRGQLRTLDEFEDMTASPDEIMQGRRLLATAKYIRALFNAAGMCERRRRV